MLENTVQDKRQIKNTDNTETKHNAKHSKTKPWFSCL